MQLLLEIFQISHQIIKYGNRCNGRWTLLYEFELEESLYIKKGCSNIGFFVGNDDKSRDLSPRYFKKRDQYDLENNQFAESESKIA